MFKHLKIDQNTVQLFTGRHYIIGHTHIQSHNPCHTFMHLQRQDDRQRYILRLSHAAHTDMSHILQCLSVLSLHLVNYLISSPMNGCFIMTHKGPLRDVRARTHKTNTKRMREKGEGEKISMILFKN